MPGNTGRRFVVRTRDSGSEPVPVKVHHNPSIPCDVDLHCDRAKFEVVIRLMDTMKSLFFCGHHYRENQTSFAERGYEVKEIQ